MAYIGLNFVSTIRDPLPVSGRRIQFLERSGVDGEDVKQQGVHGKERRVRFTTYYVSSVTRTLGLAAYLALQGTVQDIVDDRGITYYGCVIVSVDEVAQTDALLSNTGNYRLDMEMLVRST